MFVQHPIVPRSLEDNAALRKKRRERILRAAVRLFSRRGFHRTSVRAIADEAQVALGLMYAHCESKEAVRVTLMDASVLDVTQTLEAAEQEPTAEGFVARLLRSAIALLDAHRDAWHLSYALRHQPAVLASLAGSRRHCAAATTPRLAQALVDRRGANPEIEAALFALVDGLAQHDGRFRCRSPMDEDLRAAAACDAHGRSPRRQR
jgi:AcrR family transcriptional regulator